MPLRQRGQSVRREPSRRKRELRDDGPVRPRDVQFDTNPEPHPQEVVDSSISSRKVSEPLWTLCLLLTFAHCAFLRDLLVALETTRMTVMLPRWR